MPQDVGVDVHVAHGRAAAGQPMKPRYKPGRVFVEIPSPLPLHSASAPPAPRPQGANSPGQGEGVAPEAEQEVPSTPEEEQDDLHPTPPLPHEESKTEGGTSNALAIATHVVWREARNHGSKGTIS